MTSAQVREGAADASGAPDVETDGGGRTTGRPQGIDGASRTVRSVLTDPALVSAVVVTWLAGCWMALVAATPYISDDAINKDVRTAAAQSGRGLVGITAAYTSQWMTNEGRFFPGSLGWTYSLFWYATGRVTYKIVLALVLIVAVAVVAALAARLSGHLKSAVLFVPIAFATIQIRAGVDPTIGFAGLLGLTTGLVALTVLILVTRGGPGWCLLAALTYAWALVTYETVILFAPAMVAVVVVARRRWTPALAIVVPAIVQAGLVIVLRARVVTTSVGYTTSFDPSAVLSTFATQVSAAVPLSQWLFGAPGVPEISGGALALAALIGGIPVLVALVALARVRVQVPVSARVLIGGFGAWVWLSSSVLVAVTLRWQQELLPGQGYLPVTYGYVGAALCLLALWLWGESALGSRTDRLRSIWTWSSSVGLAALVTLTLAGNIALVSTM